ncbi:MAG: DNA polymerase I [Armatimonadetes bacterium]|nr:DNA polymerase I [Armatimonadota bacterium]
MSDKLILIDGNNLVHRAYHALPPLTNSAGQPTNAVYGFVQMVLPLLEEEQPARVAVAFDGPGPTFRHEMTDTYKATRKETEPELVAQFDLARELVAALGLAWLEFSGVEADDLIGTLAEREHAEGREVLIVSADRDMVQLIKPGVAVMAPLKGMSDVKMYDEAAVREQYGVGPELIADLKALAGDTSDNIQGIAGVGPVGAAKLLQEFGGVIELYDRLGEVKQESLRRKLETGRESAMLGRQLARIKTDVPVEITDEQMRWAGPDAAAARRLFARLEFGNLLERTGHWGHAWEGEIRVADETALADVCRQAREVGHLTLAPAVGPKGERALVLCAEAGTAWVWPLPEGPAEDTGAQGLFDEERENLPSCLREALADAALPKRGVRLKEAARLLWDEQVTLEGYECDAEVADYLLAPQRSDHGIMMLAAAELGWWVPEKGEDLPGDLPVWQVRPAVEAMAAERLHEVLLEQLAAHEALSVFTDVEMPLARVLASMEQAGIAVDAGRLQELDGQLQSDLDRMTAEIYEMAGSEFNIDSPKQVGEVLFGTLGLPGGKKTKTGWSTSASVLDDLAPEHEIVARILNYRELAKLRSTYVVALLRELDPRTQRVHTTFEQTVTATGRLSSRGPNLQNIPVRTESGRQIRSCFVADEGNVLVKADYSQIELRLLAHFCGDENLTTAFQQGEDIHRRTAAMIFEVAPEDVTPDMRRVAKTVNFAVLYGMGSVALSKELGVPRPRAQEFIDQYFEALASVKEFLDRAVQEGRERGYVTTLLGRRRPMPDLRSPDRQVAAYAERAAANTPLQGSAADVVKVAMVRLAKPLAERFPQARLLLQVHDELVVEAPAAQAPQVAALLREVMEHVVELSVPLTVAVAWGQNWRDVD